LPLDGGHFHFKDSQKNEDNVKEKEVRIKQTSADGE